MKCFIIAMESEAKPVFKAIKPKNEYLYCDKRVVTGDLYGEDVGVIICGVGKVNAACATQYAIDSLHCDVIINIGVAGGLREDMKIGKLYAASEVVQYDFDLVQLNGTRKGTLNECEEPYLPLCVIKGFEPKRVGTGDRFNDDSADFLLLTGELGADVRDMELGAIAQTCMHAKAKCYSVKAVSDIAGKGSTTEQFKKNVETCLVSIEKSLEKIVKGAV